MNRIKEFTFQVSGSGKLPETLLSNQECFPASERDATACFSGGVKYRRISMKSYSLPNPNIWIMHGWVMSGINKLHYESDDYSKYHTWPC